jgi:glycerophosphoryl diester phosphodiesterase
MNTQVVGHRGASGYAPETTLEAYRLAIEMGADFVEADVHRLRDGTIVAIHDANLKRTTNGRGWVANLTLADIKALDAGSWFNNAYPEKARPEYAGLQIPTLQEVIDLVKVSRAGLFIEIKDRKRYPEDLESSLLSIVRSNQMEKRTRFLSFSAQSLRKIKELDASMPTMLLISKPRGNPVKATLKITADELGLLHDHATSAIVAEARKHGLLISVWTVDEPEEMRRMMELGVDRITTNYPDRLVQLLGRDLTYR